MASLVQELYFPHLEIPITIDHVFPVKPAGPIPARPDETLYLSNLDNMIGTRVFTPTVFFYRKNNFNPDEIMKSLHEALARVLIPYYPFSGRLREKNNGKLEVFFGAEQGALMVRAQSNMGLGDLGDLTIPNPGWAPLVYRFAKEGPYKVIDMPLLIAQVTFFKYGGFSIGLRTCHCLCDGIGAMQFLKAWSSTTKSGFLIASPDPCWEREIFRPRDPPTIEYPHEEFMRIEDGSNLITNLWKEKPVQKCFRVSREFQTRLKNLALKKGDYEVTTFDAIAAHVWRSWVKALDVKPEDCKLRLTFSVNVRQKLSKKLIKDGFYGNAVSVACAKRKACELVNGSLSETSKLVHDARIEITEKYLKSTIDFLEVKSPKRLEFDGKLTITQWTRFSIYESSDFGWGKPVYAGPIDLTPTPQVCMLLPEGGGSDYNGTMLVCICLPEPASIKFKEFLCFEDSDDKFGEEMV